MLYKIKNLLLFLIIEVVIYLTLDFLWDECRHSETSSQNRCINHRRRHGISFRQRLCFVDRQAKIIFKIKFQLDLADKLTFISFEFLSNVANGRSGSFSSLFVSSCIGAECFSKAFANPLNFFSSTCSNASVSIFSIFSQKPRQTAAAFNTFRFRAMLCTFLTQILSI